MVRKGCEVHTMFRLTVCLLLCLTIAASARPPAVEETIELKAVNLRDGGAPIWDVDDDFPREYLTWGYERPEMLRWHLSYLNWEKEYRKYFWRNYREKSLTFTPTMIVMHYTVVPTEEATYRVLQRNHVSVQLMVGRDGRIYELMPLNRRCNGAYGVNHKALSIEMVAEDEYGLLSRPIQVFRSFCLVKYLMARYNIPLENVVAHSEVGEGVTRVPQYLDYADPQYPTRYPPWSKRTDPGDTYMRWLRSFLRSNPPNASDL